MRIKKTSHKQHKIPKNQKNFAIPSRNTNLVGKTILPKIYFLKESKKKKKRGARLTQRASHEVTSRGSKGLDCLEKGKLKGYPLKPWNPNFIILTFIQVS